MSVALVFPDGETRLPAATARVQLTLEVPGAPVVEEAPVAADGSFSLGASFDAMDISAPVRLDALDGGGAVIARGLAPAIPLAAYTQRVTLFMGPPGRFATSALRLPGPRDEMTTAPLAYGVVLAGGRDAAGARVGDVLVFSAFTWVTVPGLPLPAPRARLQGFGASFNVVYFFGGLGDGDQPTADFWRFDTNVSPSGEYTTLAAPSSLARAGAAAVTIGTDKFLLAGAPPALVDAQMATATITPLTSAPAEVGSALTAATTVNTTNVVEVALGGPTGVFLYDGAFRQIGDAAIVDAAAVTLPGLDVLFIGPQTRRVTPAGVVTDITLLSTPRHRPAAAVVRGTLVVAGGFDDAGTPLGDAEVFDAETLAPRGTVPLPVARGGAIAYPLPSGHVLLFSGRTPAGPAATIDVFTP